MKNIALTIIISLGFVLSANAQCVIDTSVNQVGLFPPDSTFPCIERGQFFDEVIQFKNFDVVDGSTVGIPGIFTVQIVKITNISNIPNGINYACNPQNCTFAGNSNGCVLVSGTTNDPPGTYNLGFTADVTVLLNAQSFTIQLDSATLAGAGLGYRLVVIEPNTQCPNLPVPPAQLAVTLSGNPNLCLGDSTTITATPRGGDTTSYSFAWSPSTGIDNDTSMSPKLYPSVSTIYSVTVTDGSGDTVVSSVPIAVTSPPVADFDTTSVSGNTVILDDNSTGPVDTYLWDFGDGNTEASVNPTYTYDSVGTYTISLVVTNTCGFDSAVMTIQLSVDTISSGINDLTAFNGSLDVFPNPNNGQFDLNIQGLGSGAYTIRLFNVQGKEVYTTFATAMGADVLRTINVDTVEKGIYFLSIQTDKGVLTQKILITN